MKQYVTLDKRSKKAQKEYYSKQRRTWGVLNPVTRSVPSGKTYNRKKDKQERRRIGKEFSDGFDVDFLLDYSDNEEPFSAITIVEFKKPDNDSKNPINQVLEYIELIRSGKKKKINGQSFSITEGTVFRCYIICDLTDKMRTHCMNGSLLATADNLGYSGYNQGRHAYIEVISYNKMLADAKKRNDIFFDKLFAPDISNIIHLPNDDNIEKN